MCKCLQSTVKLKELWRFTSQKRKLLQYEWVCTLAWKYQENRQLFPWSSLLEITITFRGKSTIQRLHWSGLHLRSPWGLFFPGRAVLINYKAALLLTQKKLFFKNQCAGSKGVPALLLKNRQCPRAQETVQSVSCHQQPFSTAHAKYSFPGSKLDLPKTLEFLTIVIQSSLPSDSGSQELLLVCCSPSHWILWRLRMSHVVRMYRHRLYFSPSIASLDALEISRTKRTEEGLQLAIAELPLEYALKNMGPSFSTLANTKGYYIQLHFSLFSF